MDGPLDPFSVRHDHAARSPDQRAVRVETKEVERNQRAESSETVVSAPRLRWQK